MPGSLFSEANALICTKLDVCVQLRSLARPGVVLSETGPFSVDPIALSLFLFERQCVLLNTEENAYSR